MIIAVMLASVHFGIVVMPGPGLNAGDAHVQAVGHKSQQGRAGGQVSQVPFKRTFRKDSMVRGITKASSNSTHRK